MPGFLKLSIISIFCNNLSILANDFVFFCRYIERTYEEERVVFIIADVFFTLIVAYDVVNILNTHSHRIPSTGKWMGLSISHLFTVPIAEWSSN